MYKKIICGMISVVVLLFVLAGCADSYEAYDGHEEYVSVFAEMGLSVPKSQITETVMFVPVVAGEVSMEVMFVRASDGDIRVALNTCENCHASGRGYYVQDGDVVVCQQCDMSFDIDYIGLNYGGCQPIPIAHSVESDYVVIAYDALLENARWFDVN
ncbi:MAG: DUF2318 domain-containing protein [Defluviitaleaceae bacterium]|nr:DUF2318 domain-containing protein [Defluviitaleaceae bacterium]